MNVVTVRRAPFFSYAATYFLRSARMPVISASSNCVTCGMAFQFSVMRRAMTWRKGESGFLVTLPHLEKSMDSAAGFAGAPGAALGCAASFCNR